jgi:hypothetical protein
MPTCWSWGLTLDSSIAERDRCSMLSEGCSTNVTSRSRSLGKFRNVRESVSS